MSNQDDVDMLRRLAHLTEDDPVSCVYWSNNADALERGKRIPNFGAFMAYARSVIRNFEGN